MIGGSLITRGLMGNRSVGGTWTALTAWTLPAHSVSGDISIGANKLKTTSLYLVEDAVTGFGARLISNNSKVDIAMRNVYFTTDIVSTDNAAAYIKSYNGDGGYIALHARDTGVGLVEVARMMGAADPYFGIGVDGSALKGTYAGLLGFFAATPVAQQTGTAAQIVNYATPGLDTEAEIIAAFNATNTAINVLRTALNNLGLTTVV